MTSAGRRAFARGDVPAATNLLGRAIALLPAEAIDRQALLPEYGEALLQVGRFEESEAVLEQAMDEGSDPRVAAHASLVHLLVRLKAGDPESWRLEAAGTIAEAMPVFEAAGDHGGLAKAWRLLAWSHGTACHFSLAAEAAERALDHARTAGDPRQQSRAATAYAAAAAFGPTPVDEAIEHCERAAAQVSGDRQAEGMLLALLAGLVAMNGEFDRARELADRGIAMLQELGVNDLVASAVLEAWRVEMLAGDVDTAERRLRAAYDLLVAMGEKYLLSTVSGLLAQTLYVLGRYDEIEPYARLTEELAIEDDVDTQALWRCVRAKALARAGDFDAAEEHVRAALDVLSPTDAVVYRYGALLDLAEVLSTAGRKGARDALLEAAALAAAKGSDVMAAEAAALAERVGSAPATS